MDCTAGLKTGQGQPEGSASTVVGVRSIGQPSGRRGVVGEMQDATLPGSHSVTKQGLSHGRLAEVGSPSLSCKKWHGFIEKLNNGEMGTFDLEK